MDGNRKTVSIRSKMFIFIIITVFAVALGTSAIAFRTSANQIDKYYKQNTADNARNFASFMNEKADFLEKLRSVAESEEYQKLRDRAEEEENEALIEAYLKEQQSYVKVLQARSHLFMQEAKECGLDIYPYKEGFFITLRVKDNEEGKKLHEALMRNHLYTVLVNKGIRVGICALPLEKVRGLAGKIRTVQLNIE